MIWTTLGSQDLDIYRRVRTKSGPKPASATFFLFFLDILDTPRPGDQTKRGRHKGRNKQETPIYVEACQPVEKVKTPLDLAKVGAYGY